MSADNTIVILQTTGPEFRVKEIQAADNIDFYKNNPDQNKNYFKNTFGKCNVYKNMSEAFEEADRILKEITAFGMIVEYGIQKVQIDKKFGSLDNK